MEELENENNYLLLHGSFESPFSNWIPYLRKEIENKELEVYTPNLPTGVGYQNYESWSKLLKTYIEGESKIKCVSKKKIRNFISRSLEV